MDDYLKSIGNYSPHSAGTGKSLDETSIIEFDGTPDKTTTVEDDISQDDLPKYLAPRTIEVKRYKLKK